VSTELRLIDFESLVHCRLNRESVHEQDFAISLLHLYDPSGLEFLFWHSLDGIYVMHKTTNPCPTNPPTFAHAGDFVKKFFSWQAAFKPFKDQIGVTALTSLESIQATVDAAGVIKALKILGSAFAHQ
jgi:hypothetical protein